MIPSRRAPAAVLAIMPLAMSVAGCGGATEGTVAPFVVAGMATCPPSIQVVAQRHRRLVVSWSLLNRNVLPPDDIVTLDAPILFTSYADVPLSMTTTPPGAMCALTPVRGQGAGGPGEIRTRRTVAFTRAGRLEVDLYLGGEGDGVEPLHLTVFATAPPG